MGTVTAFTPRPDGAPLVYAGKLTDRQIKKLAATLGGVGDGGYAGFAVATLDSGSRLVTYASKAPFAVEPYGQSGERVLFDEQGDLSYEVVYVKVEEPPA